ncbi:MAG: hypothetical protein FJ108_12890 [Deltaproteobacteria bacterium]|nr:hypothetical protein [Deltaproteobacteria bacterium]
MSEETADILASLGPARRFADPASPLDSRLMAASGALPLPPPQLLSVLVALTLDPDAGVKDKAIGSLRGLPERVATAALGAKLPAAVLGVCAELYKDDGARLELVALNSATSDETCTFLAARPFPRLVEILAQNQVRLLRCPPLVEALGENPLTGMATIDRILHFLGVERGEMEEPEPESRAEPLPAPPPPDPDTAPDEAVDDQVEIPADLIEEAPADLPEEQKQERSQNLQARVGKMTIIEKVKLARLGNVDARSLLVRDRNKLVAAAAIRNPKITDNEIEGFARARNLCDEVMRIIAHNRQWTRAYPVKLALSMNPKCPPQTAVKFLNYLTDRDLGLIMRSRDVAGVISAQARRILARKGKT